NTSSSTFSLFRSATDFLANSSRSVGGAGGGGGGCDGTLGGGGGGVLTTAGVLGGGGGGSGSPGGGGFFPPQADVSANRPAAPDNSSDFHKRGDIKRSSFKGRARADTLRAELNGANEADQARSERITAWNACSKRRRSPKTTTSGSSVFDGMLRSCSP